MSEQSTQRFALVCTKCRTVHDIDVQNLWGSYPGTAGLGPRVVCPNLVVTPNGGQAVCKGMLAAQTL